MTRSTNQSSRTSQQRNRNVTFRISFFSLIAASAIAVVGLVWVFMLGVMVGRGYTPNDTLPQLTRILPHEEGQNTGEATSTPQIAIIEPEDLTFMDKLKGTAQNTPQADTLKPTQHTSANTPVPFSASANQKPSTKRSATSQIARSQSVSSAPVASATGTTSTIKKQPTPEPRFDYVYQVAAFKQAAPAEALQKRLEQAGQRADIDIQLRNETTWFLVLVHFRGTPEDIHTLKATLEKFGILKILLRSKTST